MQNMAAAVKCTDQWQVGWCVIFQKQKLSKESLEPRHKSYLESSFSTEQTASGCSARLGSAAITCCLSAQKTCLVFFTKIIYIEWCLVLCFKANVFSLWERVKSGRNTLVLLRSIAFIFYSSKISCRNSCCCP